MSRIITFYKKGTVIGGHITEVPDSKDAFLAFASRKLKINAKRIYSANGLEIEIESIKNGDIVYIQGEEDTLPPAVQANMKDPGKRSKQLNDIIQLNVGGKTFAVTRLVLTRTPGKLARIFNINNISTDESKPYFFNSSPTYFEYILDYLRGKRLLFDNNATSVGVRAEAIYYELYSLVHNWDNMTGVQEAVTSSCEAVKKTNIVKLNVGGKYFTTSRSTLVREPNSKLSEMIDSECEKDESGAFFIDRNPVYFEFILSYLRGEKIVFKNSMISDNVLAEAKYFGLNSLKQNWHRLTSIRQKFISRNDLVKTINKRSGGKLQFQNVYFNNADFTGINFENIDFRRASFRRCYLVAATFDVNCNLDGAIFEGAFLHYVQFKCHKLNCINFKDCVVRSEIFGVGSFERCNFLNATIDGIRATEIPESVFTNCYFINANLKDFSASQIINSKFGNSTWTGVKCFYNKLVNCDFTGAVFNGIRLERVLVENCNFTGANFNRSFLAKFNISDDNALHGAIFKNADLTKCQIFPENSFRSNEQNVKNKFLTASFIDAIFYNCDIAVGCLRKADMYGVKLSDHDKKKYRL